MKTSGRKSVKVAAVGTAGKVAVGRASKSGALLPTHDEIAQRSYELFLARGGVHGHDVEDWLQAEADLNSRAN